jgi:hypothetical protein
MVPTTNGYRVYFPATSDTSVFGTKTTPTPPTIDATNGAPCSLYAHTNNTVRTGRIFLGYSRQIYELTVSGAAFTWTNRSSGGGPYTLPTVTTYTNPGYFSSQTNESSWSFTSYGDVCFAANKGQGLQASTGAAFGAVAGAPTCRVVATFKDFIFAGDCGNYGSITGAEDMIAWSEGGGNYTNWVPGTGASQDVYAGYVRLTDTPGRITALVPLGDNIIAFKALSMYLGTYVGRDYGWVFQLITPLVGCRGPHGVINIGNALVFCAQSDYYIFDGSRPRPITAGVRNTIFFGWQGDVSGAAEDAWGASFAYRNNDDEFRYPRLGVDRYRSLVIFWHTARTDPYVTTKSGCWCFNYETNQWGRIEFANANDLNTEIPCITLNNNVSLNSGADRLWGVERVTISPDSGGIRATVRSCATSTWTCSTMGVSNGDLLVQSGAKTPDTQPDLTRSGREKLHPRLVHGAVLGSAVGAFQRDQSQARSARG